VYKFIFTVFVVFFVFLAFGDLAMAPFKIITTGVRHRSYAPLPASRSFLMKEAGRGFRNAAVDLPTTASNPTLFKQKRRRWAPTVAGHVTSLLDFLFSWRLLTATLLVK